MQEQPAFGVVAILPVDDAAFVGPNLLEIADGRRFHRGAAFFRPEEPDGIHIIMLGERFGQLGGASADDVDNSAGKIGSIEDLIEVRRDERIDLAGYRDHRIAHGDSRKNEREEAEQRRFTGADDGDGADRLVHGGADVAAGRVVDQAVELIGPGGVGEDALNG